MKKADQYTIVKLMLYDNQVSKAIDYCIKHNISAKTMGRLSATVESIRKS